MPLNSIPIRLENALTRSVRTVEVSASVDPGVLFLCLPPALVTRLDLVVTNQRRSVTIAGQNILCRYVGPVLLQIGKAAGFMGAVECGEEVVVGDMALSGLGLMIDPATGELIDNPRAWRVNTVFTQQEESFAL